MLTILSPDKGANIWPPKCLGLVKIPFIWFWNKTVYGHANFCCSTLGPIHIPLAIKNALWTFVTKKLRGLNFGPKPGVILHHFASFPVISHVLLSGKIAPHLGCHSGWIALKCASSALLAAILPAIPNCWCGEAGSSNPDTPTTLTVVIFYIKRSILRHIFCRASCPSPFYWKRWHFD